MSKQRAGVARVSQRCLVAHSRPLPPPRWRRPRWQSAWTSRSLTEARGHEGLGSGEPRLIPASSASASHRPEPTRTGANGREPGHTRPTHPNGGRPRASASSRTGRLASSLAPEAGPQPPASLPSAQPRQTVRVGLTAVNELDQARVPTTAARSKRSRDSLLCSMMLKRLFGRAHPHGPVRVGNALDVRFLRRWPGCRHILVGRGTQLGCQARGDALHEQMLC